MYYIIFAILGLIIISLLLRYYYIWNLKLEEHYRIMEMEDGTFLIQERTFFSWKRHHWHNDRFNSLKSAQERVHSIIDGIREDIKADTPVNYHYLNSGGITQNNTLLLKDLMSQLSTAVNNNNKEEEELIFNEIEKVLR